MASVSKMEGQMTREGHIRGRVFEDNHRAGKGEGNPLGNLPYIQQKHVRRVFS